MPAIKNIPIEKIEVGEHVQRMKGPDEGIEELAASICRVGVIVPLVVSRRGDAYVVVAGHRRLAACKKAGIQEVRCIVREADGRANTEVSFAENLFRKDLSPFEFGCAIKDVLDNKIMTADELAAGLHRSTEWIRRMVSMLDWPAGVLEAIHAGWLSVSAAHNLAIITDDTYRDFLLRKAEEGGVTARATAAWLQAWRSMEPAEVAAQAPPVEGEKRAEPMVPQAPCICCSNVYRTDQLSHVPVCAGCIQAIRNIGTG